MVELFRKLLISALTLGAIAGNGDEIRALFDSTVAYTQQIATAGDLRSIGYMLDYSYEMLTTGLVSSTAQIPMYPVSYLITFGLGALCLVLLHRISVSVRKAWELA